MPFKGTTILTHRDYIMINSKMFFIKQDKINSVIQKKKKIDIKELAKIDFYGTVDHKIFNYRFTDPLPKKQKKKKIVIQNTLKRTYDNITLFPLSMMVLVLGYDYYNQSKDLEKMIETNKELGLGTNDLEKEKKRKDFTYISCYIAGVSSLLYSFTYKKTEISVSPKSIELSYNF